MMTAFFQGFSKMQEAVGMFTSDRQIRNINLKVEQADLEGG